MFHVHIFLLRLIHIFVLLHLAFASHLLKQVIYFVKMKQRNKYQLSLSISNLSVVFFQNSLQLLSFGFFFLLKGWHGDMLGRADKSTEVPINLVAHSNTSTLAQTGTSQRHSHNLFHYFHTLSTFHIPKCSIKCLKLTSMYATISKKKKKTHPRMFSVTPLIPTTFKYIYIYTSKHSFTHSLKSIQNRYVKHIDN